MISLFATRRTLPSPRSAQAFLRAVAAPGRTVLKAGPFDLFLHPTDPFEFRNYAIPANRAHPKPRQIEGLRALFRAHARRPRLEFVEEAAPAVADALEAAGMRLELRAPLMACAVGDLAVRPVDGAVVGPPDDPRATANLQREAFGQPALPLDAPAPAIGENGGGAVVAKMDGVLVAVAEFSRVVDGVSEIVGVATNPGFRRRGLAGLVTAEVGRAAAAAGARILLLAPGSEGAERVYARAGFVRVATMRHVHDP